MFLLNPAIMSMWMLDIIPFRGFAYNFKRLAIVCLAGYGVFLAGAGAHVGALNLDNQIARGIDALRLEL
jgi:hypothetical protein